MNCDCISKVNERLKELNLKLSGYSFMMPSFKTCITVATQWIDREKAPKGQKRNPTAMLATYCPFCGVAVEAKGEEKQEVAA